MAEVAQFFEKKDVTLTRARDVEILYSDSAIVRAIVRGPVLLNYLTSELPRSEFPDGLTVDFFDAGHRLQSKLSARHGVRYDNTGKVVVSDSVVVTTVRGERLDTEELTWDSRTGNITTNKFVKVSTPKEIVYGYGLDARDDFSYWKIRAVTGRVAADEIMRDFRR